MNSLRRKFWKVPLVLILILMGTHYPPPEVKGQSEVIPKVQSKEAFIQSVSALDSSLELTKSLNEGINSKYQTIQTQKKN